MLISLHERKIFIAAIQKFGLTSQLLKAVEELSELQKEILKYVRCLEYDEGQPFEILAALDEERADVEIMLKQLQIIFGENRRNAEYKLSRLADMVGGDDDEL